MPITHRTIESILRISTASAKSGLRHTVKLSDVQFAISVILKSYLNTKGNPGTKQPSVFKQFLVSNDENYTLFHLKRIMIETIAAIFKSGKPIPSNISIKEELLVTAVGNPISLDFYKCQLFIDDFLYDPINKTMILNNLDTFIQQFGQTY